MKTIKRIVFTGGPCSGKTTLLSRAEEIFAERGYRVITDHESATDLISGGISPATLGMYQFQKYCIDLQLQKERLCLKAAEEINGDRVLVFIDRGILDDKGYVTPEEFDEIMKDFGTTADKLNDRYDLVVHLVTSAKGAVDAYSNANNAARYESVDEARKVDDTILDSWKDHPNRIIIENEDDFEVKMRKAIQAIFTYLGDERPVEVFKKYLVNVNEENISSIMSEQNVSYTQIFQQYLTSKEGVERRIRKRNRNDNTLYYYSEATTISANKRSKTDRIISERQFRDMQIEVDENLKPMNKERYSFVYKNHFFKLDIYDFDKTKGLLSVQIPEEDEVFELPEYFAVEKEVSEDKNYKNYFIAQTQKL